MALPPFKEITRADAASIIGSQKATDIIDVATVSSLTLGTFETVPMSKKTLTQPMLASLPDANFVGEGSTGDGNVKPTTKVSWTDKSMTAEEIAVIVPIHENILADADIDIWAAVRPKIAEAFALRLDLAVLYGVQAPASWVDADIVGKAITATNAVTRAAAGASRLDDDFNALLARVEDDGYDVTDIWAIRALRSQFRGLKDSSGAPVYLSNVRDDGRTDSIYGANLSYVHKRLVDPVRTANAVQAIAIDRTQYQVGIREDFTVKFLDQATVGGVNLAERDMVAMRFKFRVAFGSFRTPLLHEASDYPAAVLRAAA